MSARSIRRAAERKAKKLAAKAGLSVQAVSAAVTASEQEQKTIPAAAQPPLTSAVAAGAAGAAFAVATEPEIAEAAQTKPLISEAKLAANRLNAQKSHGAVTEAGKAKSKLNAVKHGLTSASVLFANESDAKRYAKHTADYQYLYKPVGPEERALVQSITDVRWRLATCPVLELAVIAKGTAALVDSDPEFWNQPENQNELFLEVRRQNETELRNLQLQENRLARRCARETAQLERLQKERKANEEYNLAQAAKVYLLAEHRDPAKLTTSGLFIPGLGFVFSAERFKSYVANLSPELEQMLLDEALAEAEETPKSRSAAA